MEAFLEVNAGLCSCFIPSEGPPASPAWALTGTSWLVGRTPWSRASWAVESRDTTPGRLGALASPPALSRGSLPVSSWVCFVFFFFVLNRPTFASEHLVSG